MASYRRATPPPDPQHSTTGADDADLGLTEAAALQSTSTEYLVRVHRKNINTERNQAGFFF